jgi:hypothetical protein
VFCGKSPGQTRPKNLEEEMHWGGISTIGGVIWLDLVEGGKGSYDIFLLMFMASIASRFLYFLYLF